MGQAAAASAFWTRPARWCGQGDHHATGRLGLHVLDAMLATADSIDHRAFYDVASRVGPVLPAGWDPSTNLVTGSRARSADRPTVPGTQQLRSEARDLT